MRVSWRHMAVAICGLPFLTVAPALAQTKPKLIGSFDDWQAYTLTQGKAKTCYMVSRPTASLPKGAKRGEIYVMISNRPADHVEHEFSVGLGYAIKKGSKPQLMIDKTSTDLVVFEKPGYDQTAWAADPKSEQAIVDGMAKGHTMELKAVSAHGTQTTDTFSLNGVTAALRAVAGACK